MATKVLMPKLGLTMDQGTVIEWLKQPGEPVTAGELLFRIEMDKAAMDIEAQVTGILGEILVSEGATVPVGSAVALVLAQDEVATAGSPTRETAKTTDAASASARAEAARPIAMHESEPSIVRASPLAKRLAREAGLDLGEIEGSGPGGRIVEQDVVNAIARRVQGKSAPMSTPVATKLAEELGVDLVAVTGTGPHGRIVQADVRQAAASGGHPADAISDVAPAETMAMTGIRRTIADHMSRANLEAPQVTLVTAADATDLVALRSGLNAERTDGDRISFDDLFAFIVVRALGEHRMLNARLEGDEIRCLQDINVGIAVHSERGLMVPVIHGAGRMSLPELASARRTLMARVRDQQATPDDLSGGTFTISNLGPYGVDLFTPIVNLPECAILGVGRIAPQVVPVAGGTAIAIRQRVGLSLSFDHRLVDGAPAARFLQRIVEFVESSEPFLVT